MRVSRTLRLFVGIFNALAAAAVAAYGTAEPVALLAGGEPVLPLATAWGAALAAALATLSIGLHLALLGWMAVGYLLWAALLAGHAFSLVFLALAVSLAPVLPRPGGSLWQGLAVAALAAAAAALIL